MTRFVELSFHSSVAFSCLFLEPLFFFFSFFPRDFDKGSSSFRARLDTGQRILFTCVRSSKWLSSGFVAWNNSIVSKNISKPCDGKLRVNLSRNCCFKKERNDFANDVSHVGIKKKSAIKIGQMCNLVSL